MVDGSEQNAGLTADRFEHDAETRRVWFRYSLRGLLLLMLLIAVYLGGRASYRWEHALPPLEGQWTMHLPSGFERSLSIQRLDGGEYLVRYGVFSGVYEWRDDRLAVVRPDDKRMKGLTWAWNGESLVLIGEPPGRPTGSSYLGTTLEKSAGASRE